MHRYDKRCADVGMDFDENCMETRGREKKRRSGDYKSDEAFVVIFFLKTVYCYTPFEYFRRLPHHLQ